MASIITGILVPDRPRINKLAATIDFAGLTTLLVIGILALLHGSFHIPPVGGGIMVLGGLGGLSILAFKKIPYSDPTSNRRFPPFNSGRTYQPWQQQSNE